MMFINCLFFPDIQRELLTLPLKADVPSRFCKADAKATLPHRHPKNTKKIFRAKMNSLEEKKNELTKKKQTPLICSKNIVFRYLTLREPSEREPSQ